MERFQFGDWLVRADENLIERDGQQQTLEPKLIDVLLCLAEHAGEVVSADQLLIECWRGTFYGDSPVHKAIALLRKALGDSSQQPRYIATIRKRGYQVLVPVTFLPYEPPGASPPPAAVVPPAWAEGSPFCGLAPFDEARAAVFFGRSRAVAEVLAALREQLAAGCAFVLMLGPSGVGKTSLVRAGVLPWLRAGHFDAGDLLDHAYLDAKAGQGTLRHGLAQAIGSWQLDGAVLFPDLRQSSPADIDPALLLARLDGAMRARQTTGRPARLLLVVDQLEGMFADSSPAECEAAVALLGALARSGHVMVLALCRSDYYAQLAAVPGLLALKEGAGHYDVRPPSLGEIAQMIRRPARAAGLHFDHDLDTQAHLDDVLLEAAARKPASLPLLQYLLQALYERRDEQGTLTFAAYRELGGIEGGLSQQAERIYQQLPAPAQQAWFGVLQRLAVVPEDEQGVIGRRVPLDSFEEPAQRLLIERFINARLFVSEQEQGRAMLSVAHEALLQHWPRARAWVAENHELLRLRSRLAERAERWQREQRPRDLLLTPGRQLDEARPLLQHRRFALTTEEQAFLQASFSRARRRQAWRITAMAAIALLALISTITSIAAYRAKRAAEHNRDQAEALIGFMLDDLSTRLRPLARLDVLEVVAKRALQHLSQLPPDARDTAAALQRATALRQIGDIENEQGHVAEASASLAQAQQILDSLAAGGDLSPAVAREQGQVAYYQGYIAYAKGDLAGAEAGWQRYREASERLMRRRPADPDSWLELSYALNNLGTLANAQQDYAKAAALFERSAALKRKVLAARPGDQTAEADLADTLSWLATTKQGAGQPARAMAIYQEQTALLDKLVAQSKQAPEWVYRAATLRMQQASLAHWLGRPDLEEAMSEQAALALEGLIRSDPKKLQWRHDLAALRTSQGYALAKQGRLLPAQRRLDEAGQLLQPLQGQDVVDWQSLAILLELYRAELARAAHHDAQALALAERAQRQMAATARPAAVSPVIRAEALRILGNCEQSFGRTSQAQAHWQQALALLDPQLATSTDPNVLNTAYRLLLDLGRDTQADAVGRRLKLLGYVPMNR